MTDTKSLKRQGVLVLAIGLAVVVALAAPSSWAQTLRAPSAAGGSGASTGALSLPAPAAATTREADHIVAVVNSEPITASEVRARLARVEGQLARNANAPTGRELEREVLEMLIVERTQLQRAAELGVRAEDGAIDQAEATIARQNQLSVEAFRERLSRQGLDPERFRGELRDQVVLQRLREREVEFGLRVSERDIDEFLLERRNLVADVPAEINLGHVLVQIPEGAGPDVVASRLTRVLSVLDKAKAGEAFADLARTYSDAPEGREGGALGLRPVDRYPSLFVDAVKSLKEGEWVGPVRSPAGFHVLKLLEKRQPNTAVNEVTQTRARHILLRPTERLSQAAAVARLAAFRDQVVSGQISFDALAREHSQDGSAREGGDLGWASPGQFVPEFENVMGRLDINEVSAPFVSRVGVHLMQVLERRQHRLSAAELRETVRAQVRDIKLEEAYAAWARDLRARAYVEIRENAR